MPQQILKRKRFFIFYFLVGYMLLVFFWWWIMMFRKDNDIHRDKVQLLYYRYQQEDSSLYLKEYDNLLHEKERRKWMIIGEGATFLILMVFGIYRLRSTVLEEVDVADKQRNFLLSITHELKSPLASAKLNLQTLNKRALSSDQQKLLLYNTESDVTRLNDLVEKILLASRIGHDNMHIHKEEVNFSELIEDCIDATKNRNPQIQLNIDLTNSVWLYGDEVLLKSLVLNLLENAVKYAPKSTPIGISLNKVQDMAVLAVCDEGKTIPDSEKVKIFDRFYRMGSEDTRTTTGVGLGLYIVQQVSIMHHGKVKIIDKKNNGKIFRIEIPYIGAI
jgi:two-component system sensor histidine kinase CiaH